MQRGLIISLIIAILLVVFALQNAEEVVIKFFGWEDTIPVVLLILVSALVGMIVSAILSISNTRKLRQEKRALEQRVNELESKLPSDEEDDDRGDIIEGETKGTFFDD
jgi:uncharacterized integral membrane protein